MANYSRVFLVEKVFRIADLDSDINNEYEASGTPVYDDEDYDDDDLPIDYTKVNCNEF